MSPCLHYLVLLCVPETIMRISSVQPPGRSTFFSVAVPVPYWLWLLKYHWKTGLSIATADDGLVELSGRNLACFIKWNKRDTLNFECYLKLFSICTIYFYDAVFIKWGFLIKNKMMFH